MQNKTTAFLVNGQYTQEAIKSSYFGDNIKESTIEPIIDGIKQDNPIFFEKHQVILLDALVTEDDPDFSALWTFHFQANDLGISDIDEFFLKPISIAWDMNRIDQVFESIHLDHHRKYNDEDIQDDLLITIRVFC